MKTLLPLTLLLLISLCSCENEEIGNPVHLEILNIYPDDTEEQIAQKLAGVESVWQLRIFTQDELVNLELFSELKRIDKLLLSGCDGLVSLDGLESTIIEEELMIIGCDKLRSIDQIRGGAMMRLLTVSNCQSLVDIAIEGGEHITNVNLVELQQLTAINLPDMKTVEEDLNVSGCPELVDLNLNQLASVNNVLNIRSNTSIEHFDQLSALKAVNRFLVQSNSSLVDINGLESLTSANSIEMRSNQIDEFCVLKGAVLSNPTIQLSIQGETIYEVDVTYFGNCE